MAFRYDITIEQGTTFPLEFECQEADGTPISLPGYTARAQIRGSYYDALPQATFTCTVNEVTGVISIVLSPAQTAAITVRKGVWDCELVAPTGDVERLVEGRVKMKPEVTRA